MTLGGLALAVGRAGGRGHGGNRKHPHPHAARRFARARGGGSVQPDGHGAPALDVLHPGGVRPVVLHGRRRPAAVRSAVAGGGVLHDRVLPALQQPGAGVLDLADEGRRTAARSAKGSSAACAGSTKATCGWCLRFRWPLVLVYLAASVGLLYVLLPRMGTEIFPDANAASAAHPPARAGRHAHRGDRAHRAARARRHPAAKPARTMSRSPAISWACMPSSYPVDLIHLFTSGPQEAVIQVALKPDAPRGEALREKLRGSLRARTAGLADLLRSRRHRQPGDELRIAHARSRSPCRESACRTTTPTRRKSAHQTGQAVFPARSAVRAGDELSHARHQHRSRPRRPVRPDHGGRGALGGAGHFVLALHRSPTTGAIRIPATPSRSRCELPQNRIQSVEDVGELPVMQGGRAEPQLTDIATLKLGTMPGLIERYNGQHVVSLTANIHGADAGRGRAAS